jgi:hypothetical protein
MKYLAKPLYLNLSRILFHHNYVIFAFEEVRDETTHLDVY